MQLELLIAGIAVMAVLVWLRSLKHHPAWLGLLGILGLTGWVALIPVWLVPVESSVGSCGSVLVREHPAADEDGICDYRVAEQYNATLPLLLGSSMVLIIAGGTAGARSIKSPSQGQVERQGLMR